MKHPRTGQRLKWEWLVDYYHACERITKLAEGVFGSGVEASRWAARMRKVLRDQQCGVTRVVQAAQACAVIADCDAPITNLTPRWRI